MNMPSLSSMLVAIGIGWAVCGVASHGALLLLYPAAWAVIGLAMFAYHRYCFAMQPDDCPGKVQIQPTAWSQPVPDVGVLRGSES
jgi:hypothetical protein